MCSARASWCLQETGRAGRDGKLATCILYYSYGDAQRTRHMIKQSAEENGTRPEQVQCNLDSLNSMVGAWLNLQRGLQLGQQEGPISIRCGQSG